MVDDSLQKIAKDSLNSGNVDPSDRSKVVASFY